ncbi:CAF17-like 4Fe-4S cluster assembly/insertion protein YgfZ [Anaeromyxobacter paludicola]|nr:glycine cleavage T C-terminal barrel domain-containing protein [Anaeromyxobacter paludicola]
MTLTEKLAAARACAAVAPISRRGVLRFTGQDRQDYLHRMLTQDVASLRPGQSAYTAVLEAKGHLVAEGFLLVLPEALLLAVDPAALAGARAHLEKFVIMDDVVVEDASEAFRVLTALGPSGVERARALAPEAPAIAEPRRGAPALDLLVPPEAAERLRAALLEGGAAALDEADLEVLRVAAGVARWGAELDGKRLPMEAGLTRAAIHFGKGCYQGQEIVIRATVRGHLQRGLVALALPPGAAAGAPLTADGQEVGQVTSAADAPEGRIGLGYVRRAHWKEGERLGCAGGEATVTRVVVEDGLPVERGAPC